MCEDGEGNVHGSWLLSAPRRNSRRSPRSGFCFVRDAHFIASLSRVFRGQSFREAEPLLDLIQRRRADPNPARLVFPSILFEPGKFLIDNLTGQRGTGRFPSRGFIGSIRERRKGFDATQFFFEPFLHPAVEFTDTRIHFILGEGTVEIGFTRCRINAAKRGRGEVMLRFEFLLPIRSFQLFRD